MALPDPLPTRFTATLGVRVRAVIEHSILKGGRQSFEAPAEGRLDARVRVDREAGTVVVVEFPAVSDRVATALGTIRASVAVEGEPEGSFDHGSGHVSVETPLHVSPKSFLARDSRVTLTLSSDARVETDGLAAQGDPLDDGDDTVRLVGEGVFANGSLRDGTIWLSLDGHVESVTDDG